MSGTEALSVFADLPGDADLTGAIDAERETPADLQSKLAFSREFGLNQFDEAERCHQLLNQLDPEPPFDEPLDERLARVLNLPLPAAPAVSEDDA